MEAQKESDDLRYSLMIGFTIGLMFRCQDPDGDVESTVLAKILEGYRTDCYELLRQAHGTLGFVAQMRDQMSLMGKSEAARYYEERVRSLHWLRNFGLHDSRSRDHTIVIPNALLINFRLWQQEGESEEIPVVGDEVDYQAVEFPDEEDSVPFDDLDKSIAIDPDDVWERVSRAMRRQDEGDYEGAIAELTRALEIEPDDASLHLSRGWVRMTIGDYDGALADFNRVIQLDPNHAVAYVSRARVKTKQGDHAGAIIDYNRVLEIRPGIASVYSDRGSAKLLMRDYEGALADFERAKELDPKWVSAARDEMCVSKADRKPSSERDGFGIDAAMRKARSRMSGSSLTMP